MIILGKMYGTMHAARLALSSLEYEGQQGKEDMFCEISLEFVDYPGVKLCKKKMGCFIRYNCIAAIILHHNRFSL